MAKLVDAAMATMPGGRPRTTVARLTFDTGTTVDITPIGVKVGDLEAATKEIVETIQQLLLDE
jgi:hypothetical protein